MLARVVEKNALVVAGVIRETLDRRQVAVVVVMARLANIAIDCEPVNLCTYIYSLSEYMTSRGMTRRLTRRRDLRDFFHNADVTTWCIATLKDERVSDSMVESIGHGSGSVRHAHSEGNFLRVFW